MPPSSPALNAGWVPPAGFLHALMNGDFQSTSSASRRILGWLRERFGLRSLAIDGDYTPNMFEAFGVEEESPGHQWPLVTPRCDVAAAKFAEGGVIGQPAHLSRLSTSQR
ncbi:hypothetical protein GS432_18730 [Rhodococcus hoagii]|nr:hypothetical protein [Prescottella equi]